MGKRFLCDITKTKIVGKVEELLQPYQQLSVDQLLPSVMIAMPHSTPENAMYFKALVNICNKFNIPYNLTDAFPDISEVNLAQSTLGIIYLGLTSDQEQLVSYHLRPSKDFDGISFKSLGSIAFKNGIEDSFLPCTVEAVEWALNDIEPDLTGKNIVILGRSKRIGKPLADLLMSKNATVTICHSKTDNLGMYTKNADIIIGAANTPNIVDATMINANAILIDCAIIVDPVNSSKIIGNFTKCAYEKSKIYTTPLGGIGKLTTTIFALHYAKALRNHTQINYSLTYK